MPYKDAARKTAWDREHRPEKLQRLAEASRWADAQLRVLAAARTEPLTAEEHKTLRRALQSQYLTDRYGLGVERTVANPPISGTTLPTE